MGTIVHVGNFQFKAVIRRKGYPITTKTFDTRDAANIWMRQTELQMSTGTHGVPDKKADAELHEYLMWYLLEETPQHKGNDSESYRICRFMHSDIADHSLNTLTPHVITQYINARKKEVEEGTVRREIELLRTIINRIKSYYRIKFDNPFDGDAVTLPAKSKSRTRRYSKDEEAWLIKALTVGEDTHGGPRKALKGARNRYVGLGFRLSIETAMRQAELLSAQWENLHLEDRYLRIYDLKNESDFRDVPLSTKAIELLHEIGIKEHGAVLPTTSDAIDAAFVRARKRAITLYKEHCQETGTMPKKGFLEDVTWHDLRHEAISRTVPKLTNILEMKAFSGHKDIRMLDRYYQPDVPGIAGKLDK